MGSAIGPIRVLHVVGCMNSGGVETWLMHVLRHRDPRTRHDFVVHSPADGAFDDEIRELGARIFRLPGYRNPITYSRRLQRLLIQEGPFDAVHSHVHHFSGIVLRAAHAAGVPARIAHSHSAPAPSDSRATLRRRIYTKASAALIGCYGTIGLAASKDAGKALFSGRARACPWRVLHCGIDLEPFRSLPNRDVVRRELGIPRGCLALGHVGNFNAGKNHHLLVRAFAEVARLRSDAMLLMIGEGPLKAAVKSEVAALNLTSQVVFTGSRSDVPRLLTGAIDVFVFPSRWEGLGLAVIEAQAAGLPVVLSDRVPEEADIVPRLIRRLTPDATPREWARAALDLEHARMPYEGFAGVFASDFNIVHSLVALRDVYESGVAGRRLSVDDAVRMQGISRVGLTARGHDTRWRGAA